MITLRIDSDHYPDYYKDIKWATILKSHLTLADLTVIDSFWKPYISIVEFNIPKGTEPKDWYWDEDPLDAAWFLGSDTVEMQFKELKWMWSNANENHKDA